MSLFTGDNNLLCSALHLLEGSKTSINIADVVSEGILNISEGIDGVSSGGDTEGGGNSEAAVNIADAVSERILNVSERIDGVSSNTGEERRRINAKADETRVKSAEVSAEATEVGAAESLSGLIGLLARAPAHLRSRCLLNLGSLGELELRARELEALSSLEVHDVVEELRILEELGILEEPLPLAVSAALALAQLFQELGVLLGVSEVALKSLKSVGIIRIESIESTELVSTELVSTELVSTLDLSAAALELGEELLELLVVHSLKSLKSLSLKLKSLKSLKSLESLESPSLQL